MVLITSGNDRMYYMYVSFMDCTSNIWPGLVLQATGRLYDDSVLDDTFSCHCRHCDDGPCVIDGIEKWYFNDKLHRDNGPAVVYPSGEVEYWNHGVRVEAISRTKKAI